MLESDLCEEKKERKGRGMSGHNEERGTGKLDPWTQLRRKEAEEPGL